MTSLSNERIWTAVATGSAVVAGLVVRKGLERGWTVMRGEEPPTNPASRRTTWVDAVAWAGATALAVGLARLVAQRGAAAGWRRFLGEDPPGV